MLVVEEIPDDGGSHPDPPDKCLPKHEFTIGIIAPKGAGKTTLIINLLKYYAKYFHQIVVFSPTMKNDGKWSYAKTLNLRKENVELKKFIIDYLAKKKKEMNSAVVPDDVPPFLLDALHGKKDDEEKRRFDPKLQDDCLYEEYTQEDLLKLIDEQQQMIDFLKEQGKPKHLADRVLFILDDLVGSDLYTRSTKDPFKIINTIHRHLSLSIIMVTQAYMEIPKTIRTNYTCLIVFEIANEQEKEAIRKEYQLGLSKQMWDKVYRICTSKKHGFLFFNKQRPPGKRIMECFSKCFSFK
jgi:hypothetical protein